MEMFMFMQLAGKTTTVLNIKNIKNIKIGGH